MNHDSSRRGVTLIELLVVIAIIALLASLLLPGFARAKAIAHATKCKSNLRQMGMALAMYVGDSQGEYPFGLVWGNAIVVGINGPEGGRFGVDGLTCPTWKAQPNGYRFIGGQLSFFWIGGAAYGYNAVGHGSSEAPNIPVGLGGLHLWTAALGDDERKLPIATLESDVVNPAEMR